MIVILSYSRLTYPTFCAKLLLHSIIYIMNRTATASVMLKQVIILTCINSPAAARHVRELLIESKKKLIALKGNNSEFNTWVRTQMDLSHSREHEAVDLFHYLWKAL